MEPTSKVSLAVKAAGTVIFTAVRATSLIRTKQDAGRVAQIHLKAEKM